MKIGEKQIRGEIFIEGKKLLHSFFFFLSYFTVASYRGYNYRFHETETRNGDAISRDTFFSHFSRGEMEIFADSGQLHGFVGEKKEKEDDISRLIARLSKGNGGEILATASPPQRLLSKLSRCSVAVSKLILSRNLLDRRPLAPLESSRYPREDVPSGNALHSCCVSLGLREYFGVSREIRSSLFLSLYLSISLRC